MACNGFRPVRYAAIGTGNDGPDIKQLPETE